MHDRLSFITWFVKWGPFLWLGTALLGLLYAATVLGLNLPRYFLGLWLPVLLIAGLILIVWVGCWAVADRWQKTTIVSTVFMWLILRSVLSGALPAARFNAEVRLDDRTWLVGLPLLLVLLVLRVYLRKRWWRSSHEQPLA